MGFELSQSIVSLVKYCKTQKAIDFRLKEYDRMLPHELKAMEPKDKRGGGGFFGFGGAGDEDSTGEDGVEVRFVHGLEPVHHDWQVVDVLESAKSLAAPPAVQREAVILHYLVDTHYDTVVQTLVEQQMSRIPLL